MRPLRSTLTLLNFLSRLESGATALWSLHVSFIIAGHAEPANSITTFTGLCVYSNSNESQTCYNFGQASIFKRFNNAVMLKGTVSGAAWTKLFMIEHCIGPIKRTHSLQCKNIDRRIVRVARHKLVHCGIEQARSRICVIRISKPIIRTHNHTFFIQNCVYWPRISVFQSLEAWNRVEVHFNKNRSVCMCPFKKLELGDWIHFQG